MDSRFRDVIKGRELGDLLAQRAIEHLRLNTFPSEGLSLQVSASSPNRCEQTLLHVDEAFDEYNQLGMPVRLEMQYNGDSFSAPLPPELIAACESGQMMFTARLAPARNAG